MNNVLSLERMDNILVGATLEDFYGASGMAGKETPEETTEGGNDGNDGKKSR